MASPWKQRAFADAVCEPKMTDQSILNWHAWCYTRRRRWRPCEPGALGAEHRADTTVRWLPVAFNTKWYGKVHGPTLKRCPTWQTLRTWRQEVAAMPAILHFHGPLKPWAKHAKDVTMAGKVWSRWCTPSSQCIPSEL